MCSLAVEHVPNLHLPGGQFPALPKPKPKTKKLRQTCCPLVGRFVTHTAPPSRFALLDFPHVTPFQVQMPFKKVGERKDL